jgi:hypothetical protein
MYYSILEKMANVQSTISTLQDLSDLTKKLCHGFEEDAIEIQREVQDQLDGFGGFNTQKSRIESLEWRLKSSQETTATLTDRLDAAHERLRVLEAQEAEVQATISRKLGQFYMFVCWCWLTCLLTVQLRIFWGILGGALATLLALLILHNFTPPADYTGIAPSVINATPPVEVKENTSVLDGTIMSLRTSSSTCRTRSTSPAYINEIDEDPRLRLFEEL